MSNILTAQKTIENPGKLQETFNSDPICGPTFDFIVTKGNEIRVYFTEAMSQEIADQGTDLINNHVDVDVLDEETNMTIQKQAAGWGLYQKIVADINLNGGLQGYLDDNQIPAYQQHLTTLRHMLKDGFPEYALRKYVTDIQPLGLWPQAQSDKYIGWIAQLALDYGADQALIGAIQAVPKGQYPFGSTGAP